MKCQIYICRRRAFRRGFCKDHYEREITPRKSRTKKELVRGLVALKRMLVAEWRVRLPQRFVRARAEHLSKAELREHHRGLWRFLDGHIVPQLRHRARRAGFGPFLRPGWEAWERLCLLIAQRLYGKVLSHPRLLSRQIPDLVPLCRGVRLRLSTRGTCAVAYAPVIIEAKFSLVPANHARRAYGPYAGRVEVWVFRWERRRLAWRTRGLVYRSAGDLAVALARTGARPLAKFLRRLPILWGYYELAELYGHGIRPQIIRGRTRHGRVRAR